MTLKTALLDCDGVLVDCVGPVHRAAERILHRELPPPNQWCDFEFGVSMGLSPAEGQHFFDRLISQDDLGWQINPYPGAFAFTEEIRALGYDICIVTSHWKNMPCWVPARDALIEACFPGTDVIYAHNKTRVIGDWLVDDKPSTIAAAGPRGILFSQPWNESYTHPRRARGYGEVLEMLR